MGTRLTLRLTGPFAAITADGQTISDLPRRGQAILAYLATQPGMMAQRSMLSALIWGDRGKEQARASLRQELSQLRKSLPEGVLEADRADVRLDPEMVEIEDGGEAAFLQGFDLSAADFEDWLRLARTISIDRRRDAVIVEGQAALRDRSHAASAEAARKALRMDPTSETAMQLLLRAGAHLEDRAGVMAEFARFRDNLMRDLGVEPANATLELADALKDASPRAQADDGQARGTWSHMRPVVAVLPFEELGADPGDMFADGIVEEVTSALSRVSEFHTIARQSTVALKGKRLDHVSAGNRLGADYLVEGTVRRSGERVRITAQLAEAATGRMLWSDRYDDRLGDLFDLQDRIAEAIGAAVWPSLRTAEIQRASRRRPPDRSVYELVLTAYPHIWAHRRNDNERAIEILDAALERDPSYPVALALKAFCHAGQCAYFWTRDPEADRATAQRYVDLAISETMDNPSTLVACSSTTTMISDNLALAQDLNGRALWLDPNNAMGWGQAGWIANYTEEPEKALQNFERADRLSPLDPFRFTNLFGKAGAMVKYQKYEEARRLVEEGMRITTTASWAYRMLAAIDALAGNMEAARESARRLMDLYPHLTLEYLEACLPPSHAQMNPRWLEAMVDAGIARR